MCLRPTVLKNSSIYSASGTPLTVPCGHCSDCLELHRLDWETRIYFEQCSCESHGGFCLYFTLTYSDCFVPRVKSTLGRLLEKYLSEQSVPLDMDAIQKCSEDFRLLVDFTDPALLSTLCFNRSHFPGFVKRVRTALFKQHIPLSVRYFAVEEYGSDSEYTDFRGRRRKGTHRPHYHVLMWFTPVETFYVEPSLIEYVRNLVCQKWPFGQKSFTSLGDSPLGLVTSSACIGYVSKYLNKFYTDDGILSQTLKNTDSFLENVKHDLDLLYAHFPETDSSPLAYRVSILRNLKKAFLPRHFQSTGIGRDFRDFVDAQDLEDGICRIPFYDKKSQSVVTHAVHFPRYFDLCLNTVLVEVPRHFQPSVKRYVLHDAGQLRKIRHKMSARLVLRDKLAEFEACIFRISYDEQLHNCIHDCYEKLRIPFDVLVKTIHEEFSLTEIAGFAVLYSRCVRFSSSGRDFRELVHHLSSHYSEYAADAVKYSRAVSLGMPECQLFSLPSIDPYCESCDLVEYVLQYLRVFDSYTLRTRSLAAESRKARQTEYLEAKQALRRLKHDLPLSKNGYKCLNIK